ncbi:MAG: hypothetical protein JF628_13380, partial [Sphingomonas sp.]|nr:hypothetical protein [Sphingomonas sp.]
VSQTLGTALGDWAADTGGLGFSRLLATAVLASFILVGLVALPQKAAEPETAH